MTDLRTETAAQERFADDVLGWGRPRPAYPPDLAVRLRDHLDAGLSDLDQELQRVASGRRGGSVSIGRRVVQRRVCDGWQLDPEPFRHTRASVRASLARELVAADWDGGRGRPAEELAAEVWHDAATRRPGDPASLSAWLNRRTAAEATDLRREVADLLEDLREVWPPLPASDELARAVQRPIEVPLAGGLVTLFGVPDLVLDSRRRDDRARSLVVDLRTGTPLPERDREGLRFHALLVALDRGAPPFRWASYHVTEGRTELENLASESLFLVADEVVDTVRQLARLTGLAGSSDHDHAQVLMPGAWCMDCRRRSTCEVAQASGVDA